MTCKIEKWDGKSINGRKKSTEYGNSVKRNYIRKSGETLNILQTNAGKKTLSFVEVILFSQRTLFPFYIRHNDWFHWSSQKHHFDWETKKIKIFLMSTFPWYGTQCKMYNINNMQYWVIQNCYCSIFKAALYR